MYFVGELVLDCAATLWLRRDLQRRSFVASNNDEGFAVCKIRRTQSRRPRLARGPSLPYSDALIRFVYFGACVAIDVPLFQNRFGRRVGS